MHSPVMIYVSPKLSIPKREINFVFGTSSGPGGQHVNRVATKATLRFDIWNATTLTQAQKHRVASALATRINKEGILRVSSSKHRSQSANKEVVLERFAALMQEATKPIRKRRKTKVPPSSKIKRIENKKRRGETKRIRGKIPPAFE